MLEWSVSLLLMVKVDVYSYGMVFFEFVVGRRILDDMVGEVEFIWFFKWVFWDMIDGSFVKCIKE